MSSEKTQRELATLNKEVTDCRKCPRLVRYIGEIREKFPTYRCKPVPGFGDPDAKILLLGLAPGRYGSNRTGRMFTGDASGKFLFRALYDLSLASRADAVAADDGLKLKGVYITAVARCAPPQNKPTPKEIRTCYPYAQKEMEILPNLKVVVALGRIAHDHYLRGAEEKLSAHAFKHGAAHRLDGHPVMVDIYHPSRQNTQTGLLTIGMFKEVLRVVVGLADNRK